MPTRKTYPQIEEIKNQIVNQSLIIGTSVGFIAYLLSLARYSKFGYSYTYISDFLLICLLFGITIYRKRLSIHIKSQIAITAIYLLFVLNIIELGIFSADKVLIILIPFLSLLGLSKSKSAAIFAFTIFSFAIVAYFHLSGVIKTPTQNNIGASEWLINILLIVIVSLILVIIQIKFNNTYTKLIFDLEVNNKLIGEKERNYREIFNASTDAIFIHDLDGKILDVNKSMLKMYGFEPDDFDHIAISDLSSQNEHYTTNDITKFVKRAANGNPQLFDWQAKKKNGDFFWVEVALKKTTLGNNDRILAIVRNINKKKEYELQLELYRSHLKELVALKTNELEKTNEELITTNDNLAQQKEELLTTLNELQITQKQLVQSEKMASLGILAAGIAHEINNPLNFIQGGLYGLENLLEEKLPELTAEYTPLLKGIDEGIRRASNIVTSLNHYSGIVKNQTAACNIHSIIDNCLLILSNQLKTKTEVHKDYSNAKFKLIANEGQIHQVLLNVLTNSVHAIENNGIIDICTTIINSSIVISIKDNGSGISEEHLPKIFDPFFTTKAPGMGTGIGLSISLKILQDHNGKIEYHSKINKGTEVVITLPISN